MGWTAIIAVLLEFLGPYFAKWLADCGKAKAEEAAAELPPVESFPSEDAARDALFDRVRGDLPRFALGRRAALRFAKRVCSECGVTSAGVARPMGSEDADLLRELGAAAARE